MSNSRRIKIAPSILAADFGRLAEQVREAESGGADRIHVDAMDGHFVPNLGLGPHVVHSLRNVTRLPFEVHLMIDNPDKFIRAFADAGGSRLLVHVEGNAHLHRSIDLIKSAGCQAGVVINPATPLTAIDEVLTEVDLVLAMTVDPGFAGQEFIEATLPKVRQLRQVIDSRRLPCELEVDGGIDRRTAQLAVGAGANVLVAGSVIFQSGGIAASTQELGGVSLLPEGATSDGTESNQ
ncbi:MAG: ribulose-phosphate 3-epimerase [Pirellulaceae bacterium]